MTRRCGSCARPGAASPSTAPCAATARSSTPIKQPDLAAEITCNRCAATASMPPCSTPTSSCPCTPSASASTSRPGTGPVAAEPFRAVSDLRRLRPLQPGRHRLRRRHGRLGSPPSSAPRRRCWRSPAPRSPSPATSSKVARAAPTSTPRRCCTPTRRLWHELMDALAAMAVAFVDVQLAAGARGVPAVRLVGRHAVGRRLRPLRPPPLRRVFAELAERHPDAPGIHFGIGCDHLLESMAAAGRAGDRARLADVDRRGAQAARRPTSRSRATSTRRSCSPEATSPSPAPRRCSPTTAASRGTSSTSATACHPASDPGVLAAVVDYVHEATRSP